MAERAQYYGDPTDNFAMIAHLTRPLMEAPHLSDHPEIRHALYMIQVKVARLAETCDHEDSWLDIIGYVLCALAVLNSKARQ